MWSSCAGKRQSIPRCIVAARCSCLFAAGIVLLFLAGCGGGRRANVTLDVKVILPPGLKLTDMDTGTFTFQPVDQKKGEFFNGIMHQEPNFQVKGVTPGQYKIAVRFTPYGGSPNAKERAEKLAAVTDPLKGKLSCEITEDSHQSITIDLAKGKVSKN